MCVGLRAFLAEIHLVVKFKVLCSYWLTFISLLSCEDEHRKEQIHKRIYGGHLNHGHFRRNTGAIVLMWSAVDSVTGDGFYGALSLLGLPPERSPDLRSTSGKYNCFLLQVPIKLLLFGQGCISKISIQIGISCRMILKQQVMLHCTSIRMAHRANLKTSSFYAACK